MAAARHPGARFLGTALTLLLAGLAALMLVPALFGLQRYVITGGSMTGTYDRGSLVFDRVVATDGLRVGDVITYTPPPDAGVSGRVTHRIHSIRRGPGGTAVYRTKGDANRTPDPWTFDLPHPTQARVAFHVPLVGYAYAALGVRWIRTLVIGLPALLIALALLAGLWRDAGIEAARRAEGAPS
jgi:signal peptidase I